MKSKLDQKENAPKITFPVLAKAKSDETVVLFTSPTCGTVLVPGKKDSESIGEFSKIWCQVSEGITWQILPPGSTVTLEQE